MHTHSHWLQYTWQHDRLWRKNRNKYAGAPCTGIDINRNFPTGFKPVSDCRLQPQTSFTLSPSLFFAFVPSLLVHSPSLHLFLPLSPQKPITDACAEDYPGPNALSELEAQHVVNFFRQHGPVVGAIDWHSYGQLILRPWGYTNDTSPDEAWLKRLSTEMANIMKRVCAHTRSRS